MRPRTRRWAPHGPITQRSALTHDGAQDSRDPTLWDTLPLARTGDPDTSARAGLDAVRSAGRLHDLIEATHRAHLDGLTDDQLAQLLPDEHGPSLSKRRGELVRMGVLADSGRRIPTRRGSLAVCWVLAPDGTP